MKHGARIVRHQQQPRDTIAAVLAVHELGEREVGSVT
jgi:hypothetical protein